MTVELRDAHSIAVRRIVDGATDLSSVLPALGDPDFPMLSLVDPYGDTIFSSLQMRAVIPELHRLRKLSPNPQLVLDELEDLADEGAEGIHVFLVFVGD